MLNLLAKNYGSFDMMKLKTIRDSLEKLFGGLRKQLDKILDKYKTMGDEVDKNLC